MNLPTILVLVIVVVCFVAALVFICKNGGFIRSTRQAGGSVCSRPPVFLLPEIRSYFCSHIKYIFMKSLSSRIDRSLCTHFPSGFNVYISYKFPLF